MALAKLLGSLISKGLGLPWPTSQNGQRLVHISPIIIKVAVPPLKHSCRLGQAASSHTVAILWLRKIFLISCTLGDADKRTRIHGGLRCTSTVGITLTGIRSTLSALRSFSPCCRRRVRFGGVTVSMVIVFL